MKPPEPESLAKVFSCSFCEISKNTISHRTPLVAASGNNSNPIHKDTAINFILLIYSLFKVDRKHQTWQKTEGRRLLNVLILANR